MLDLYPSHMSLSKGNVLVIVYSHFGGNNDLTGNVCLNARNNSECFLKADVILMQLDTWNFFVLKDCVVSQRFQSNICLFGQSVKTFEDVKTSRQNKKSVN